MIKCPKCHVYNRVCSTFCSACEKLLQKSAQANMNLLLGNATKEELKSAYADDMYNLAVEAFHRGAIKKADELLRQALKHGQHPDYSFFYGLCRLAFNDTEGAIESFEEVLAQQYAGRYPFWPLPVSPSEFKRNFEILKRDKTQGLAAFTSLMLAYRQFTERRRKLRS